MSSRWQLTHCIHAQLMKTAAQWLNGYYLKHRTYCLAEMIQWTPQILAHMFTQWLLPFQWGLTIKWGQKYIIEFESSYNKQLGHRRIHAELKEMMPSLLRNPYKESCAGWVTCHHLQSKLKVEVTPWLWLPSFRLYPKSMVFHIFVEA